MFVQNFSHAGARVCWFTCVYYSEMPPLEIRCAWMGAGGEEEGIGLPAEVPAQKLQRPNDEKSASSHGSLDEDDGWSAATTARKRPDNGRSAGQSESTTV